MAAGVTEAFNDVVTRIIDTPELWSKERPTTKTKRPVPRDTMAAAAAGQQRWRSMAQQQQRGMGSSRSGVAQAAAPAAVQCGARSTSRSGAVRRGQQERCSTGRSRRGSSTAWAAGMAVIFVALLLSIYMYFSKLQCFFYF
jgi:hypothetical protein